MNGRETEKEFSSTARQISLSPKATLEQLNSREWLEARQQELIKEFVVDLRKFGFTVNYE